MSLQRISTSRKYQSNIEVHTKNNLINSLINQKLSQEKKELKERFVKLLKKSSTENEVQRPNSGSNFHIRKKGSSLKNLNIGMEEIRSKITFNPLKGRQLSEQEQFMISRQYKSSIIVPGSIQQISTARQNRELLQVKLSESDNKNFEYLELQSSLNNRQDTSQLNKDSMKGQISNSWPRKLQQSLDKQLWLPSSPYTMQLLQTLEQNSKKINFPLLKISQLLVVKSPTFNNHHNNFGAIKDSSSYLNHDLEKYKSQYQSSMKSNINESSKLLSKIKTQKPEIVYDFKKYHKDDYVALELWFQRNISLAHKFFQTKKQSQFKLTTIKNTQNYKSHIQKPHNNKQLLNLLYSVHIGGFQELLRLIYVEAWQKAIITQKIFWSLIRLFNHLVEEQHKINFAEYRTYQKEITEQRQMYEDRCKKLEEMMKRAQRESLSTQNLRQKLSLAYVTYARVNRQLCEELEYTHLRLTEIQKWFVYLNMKMMKVIDFLKTEDKLKIVIDEHETTYYLRLGNSGKIEELIRVKTDFDQSKKIMKKKAEKEILQKFHKKSSLKQQSNELQKNNKNKSFQSKKQDNHSLNIDENLNDQIEMQILQKRSLIENDFSKNISQVFQSRIGDRIHRIQHQLNKYWLRKQDQFNLRDIIDSELLNYNTFDIGTSTYDKFETHSYGTQIPEKEEKSFAQFLREELQKQREVHQSQIKEKTQLCISLRELYEESYQKIKSLQRKNNELQLEIREKNSIIAKKDDLIQRLQTQAKFNSQDIEIKLNTIEEGIKKQNQLQFKINSLQNEIDQQQRKYNNELQNSKQLVKDNLILKEKIQKLSIKNYELQQKIELIQSKNTQIQIQLNQVKQLSQSSKNNFQSLQSKLQLIAPSIDNFLNFRRYDLEAPIIATLKKQLEKYFPDYFCKDSDIFLTKG